MKTEERMNVMKKAKKILGVLVLIMVLVTLSLVFFLTRGLEEGKALPIGEVDIYSLEDGKYIGTHSEGRWENEVEVEVVGGIIRSIDLREGFRREEVKEEIYERVIREQSLNVEVLSGATVSSKAYLKAIENALKGE